MSDENGHAGTALQGALGYFYGIGLYQEGTREVGTGQQVLAIWHINIILGGETLQDISVSHLIPLLYFSCHRMTGYLVDRYPGYSKVPK